MSQAHELQVLRNKHRRHADCHDRRPAADDPGGREQKECAANAATGTEVERRAPERRASQSRVYSRPATKIGNERERCHAMPGVEVAVAEVGEKTEEARAAAERQSPPRPRLAAAAGETRRATRYMTPMASSTPPNETRSCIMKCTIRQPCSVQSCCAVIPRILRVVRKEWPVAAWKSANAPQPTRNSAATTSSGRPSPIAASIMPLSSCDNRAFGARPMRASEGRARFHHPRVGSPKPPPVHRGDDALDQPGLEHIQPALERRERRPRARQNLDGPAAVDVGVDVLLRVDPLLAAGSRGHHRQVSGRLVELQHVAAALWISILGVEIVNDVNIACSELVPHARCQACREPRERRRRRLQSPDPGQRCHGCRPIPAA